MDRLTVTLDEEVTATLNREAERIGKTPDEIVNETMREKFPVRGVAPKPFVVRARNLGKPLIDLDCTGRALEILDELDALDELEK